ncbi:small secreted protein [Thelonectria olida]|uniref:Small secreted protein n=1 Tax=Thelonectria olida TaxID=1576542 RepID=A0A9P8VTM4_9HYPO|nr:small secreted protein [Thelonectria olida]
MKFTIALAALASVAVASPGFSPNDMNRRTGNVFNCGNNCGRAVKAYSQGSVVAAQHVADCQSFLAVTSTHPAQTVTQTRTVPAYASPCRDKNEYVSACGCVTAVPNTVWVDACATVTVVEYA